MSARLLDAGDSAVTVEFGNVIAADLVARVAAFDRALAAARQRGELPGVVEAMPTFRSLTLLYDPLQTDRARIDPVLQALLAGLDAPPAAGLEPPQAVAGDQRGGPDGRDWRLPVCYGADFGADLPAVALATGLSADAVVRLHASTEFRVYMIGFMPGFAFMGGLPAALQMPRLRQPRLRVPAGSVAITGGLTAVYPWQSPGGWQLIGRCPVPLFDATAARPSLLAPGDRVRFDPVSPARLAELEAALRAGELTAAACCDGGEGAACCDGSEGAACGDGREGAAA